jgi:hypothetical protein
MKIDFSQKIAGPDGKELDIHLGQVALNALNAPEREPLSLDQAIKRGSLALTVADGGEHEITPEDASLIRSLLPKTWAPVVVARAAKMLEG